MSFRLLGSESSGYPYVHPLAHPKAITKDLYVPLHLCCGLQSAPQCAAAKVLMRSLSHWTTEFGKVLEGTVQYQGIHQEHSRHQEVLILKMWWKYLCLDGPCLCICSPGC